MAINSICLFSFSLKSHIVNDNSVYDVHLNQYFLIVVTHHVRNVLESVNAIFDLFWRNGLLASHVLIQAQPYVWSMYAYVPYQRDCFTLDPVIVAIFTPHNFTNNMNATIDELFPMRLNNFRNCPLYIAPSFLKPFLYMENNSIGMPEYKGIDINILDHISKALNFSIIYKRESSSSGHGSLLPNGSITDHMGLVSLPDVCFVEFIINLIEYFNIQGIQWTSEFNSWWVSSIDAPFYTIFNKRSIHPVIAWLCIS